MSKLINILQTKHEVNTPASVIKKIYKMIEQQEILHNDSVFNNNSSFDGEITLSSPTYKEWADKIKEYFPNLIINSSYYMLFKDSVVESLMTAHLLSKGVGDGIGITYEDASNRNITDLPRFMDNKDIEYFDELIYFTRINSIYDWKFSGCSNLKSINIQNITSIGDAAFNICTSLEEITLGNITQLGYACFSNCSSLTTVNTPTKLKSIGESCFRNNTLLENIDLSECTYLGAYAFADCKWLGAVDISKVTDMHSSVFDNCTNLELINTHLICDHIYQYAFHGCKKITEVYIPNATAIDRMAFNECTDLTAVYESSNVTYVKDNAFSGDKFLETIDLSSCTSIDYQAFKNCESLQNVDLSKCTYINYEAFLNCKSLTSVNLSSLTSCGRGVFQGCTNLTEIILGPDLTQLPQDMFNSCGQISFNDTSHITSYGGYSLYRCTLPSLTLNTTMTSLGGLSYVTIQNEVIIPSSITTLKSNCFSFANIPSLKFLSSTPPTAEDSAFHNLNIQKIKVPSGSLSAYKSAGGDWNRYSTNTTIWEEY